MHEPGKHSEIENIIGYLQQQIDGIRQAAHGLSEEQARLAPCVSALSIGGLVKHATYVCNGLRDRDEPLEGETGLALTEQQYDDFYGSFTLAPDETLAGALAAYDKAAWSYLSSVSRIDPDAVVIEPPAPWYGRYESTETTARFAMLHGIEELARHAGHADIIREQVDGANAASLAAAAEDRPANAFVTPWAQPA